LSPKRIEFLFSALIVLLLGWGLWEARTWPLHSRIFPWSIGFGVLVLALIQLIASTRRVISAANSPDDAIDANAASSASEHRKMPASSRGMPADDFPLPDKVIRRRVTVMCSWILVFFLGIWFLGFRVGSFVLTLAFMKLAARESWRISVAAGGISYLFFLLVFHFTLQVPLAPGLLTEFLGMDSLDDYLINRLVNLSI